MAMKTINGHGDGQLSPDAKNIASGTLACAPNELGSFDGRVYLM
jgi:hypothetical protein